MNPLQSLDREALLDVLTEYYQKYRETIESSCNEKEYSLYHDSLMAILEELERRREHYSPHEVFQGNMELERSL